jgi:hypothetical protein
MLAVKARRDLLDLRARALGDRVAQRGPLCVRAACGHPLHEQRSDVRPARREARVERGRQSELDERALGHAARARVANAASSASRSPAPTWIVPRCSGPAPDAVWPRNEGSGRARG